MNQERTKEWIIALLSDEYKQGQGRLRDKNDEFCCLGVYCDLRVKRGIGHWENDDTSPSIFYVDETKYVAGGSLPQSVMAELGMSGHFETELIHQNDSVNSDFESIAYKIAEEADLLEFYNEHKAQHNSSK